MTTNPTELIDSLDADAIRARLDAIEREREALMVLLRAAIRAKRNTATATTPQPRKRKAVKP